MKKQISTTILLSALCLFFAPSSAQPSYMWAGGIGGNGYDSGNDIAVDVFGNVYVTGDFQGTCDFDPGSGTANLTSAGGNDMFFAKYDYAGNYIWAYHIGESDYDIGYSITLDTSANIYITGKFSGTTDFDPGTGTANLISAGGSDVFFAKYDPNGNYVWAYSIGTIVGNNAGGNSIGTDHSGNVFVTGYFYGTADFDPGTGTANLSSFGNNQDMFLAKYDANGSYLWAVQGGGSCIFGNSLAMDGSGDVYVTGKGAGIFMAKYDSNGNSIWMKDLTGGNYEIGRCIALDDSSNAYITGWYQGTVDFDPSASSANLSSLSSTYDVYFAKYDSLGNYVWAASVGGGTTTDYGFGAAVDGVGNVYITGYFWFTADFDPNGGTANLASAGNTDAFFAKYCQFTCSPPIANFTASITNLCTGTCINFSDSSSNNPLAWNWSFPGATPPTSTAQNPGNICYYTPGQYPVTLIIANSNGSDTMAKNTFVTVNPLPVADAGADITITQGADTMLSATGGSSYSWSPSYGLSDTAIFNPITNPDTTVSYHVTVTDSNGCTDTDTIIVFVIQKINEIKCEDLFVPTAFSPNTDGQNDVLFIRSNCVKEFLFTIYDRWGNEVFKTNDAGKGWDGKFNNEELNTAVFAYYLKAILSTGDQITRKGNVSLIR